MIRENTLIMYADDQGEEFLRKEKDEQKKFLQLIETLRSLREFDPESYGELEEAMRFLRGEVHLYSINLLAEYGLLDNPTVQDLLERQQRILSIVHSNKNLDSILKAVDYLAIKERGSV